MWAAPILTKGTQNFKVIITIICAGCETRVDKRQGTSARHQLGFKRSSHRRNTPRYIFMLAKHKLQENRG